MTFWCRFFMSNLILGFGSLILSSRSIECSCMAPHTPAVIVMRGLIFQPQFCMLLMSGLYLVCLFVVACAGNLSWQYVNLMNCTV